MSLLAVAFKCKITNSNLTGLINGKVSVGVAAQLGMTSSTLQSFIDGGTSISLAAKMGITSSSLQELRNSIGKQGAIGLIIGLMYSD